jgi:tetratricopeptide (TPR) repeat protein
VAAGFMCRFDKAVRVLDEAVRAARHAAVPDELLQSCLYSAGWVAFEAGAPPRAMELLAEALDIPAEPGRIGLTLYQSAMVAVALGRLDDADAGLAAALKIARQIRDERGLAYLDQVQSDVDIRRRRYARATAGLARAREVHERLGANDGIAEALRSTGDLAAAQSQWAEAATWYRRSLDVWRRIDASLHVARTLARLERVQLALGEPAAADAARAEYEAILADLRVGQDSLYLPPFLAASPKPRRARPR